MTKKYLDLVGFTNFAGKVKDALSNKVDTVDGMGLSQNSFTDEEKVKVASTHTELEDARTGYDGTEYSSVGTAVRTQVDEISSWVSDISSKVVFDNQSITANIWDGAYIDGMLISNNQAHAYLQYYADSILIGFFPVEEGKTYTIKNGDNNMYVGAVAFYNADKHGVCAVSADGVTPYGGGDNFWTTVDGLVTVSGGRDHKTITILENSNISYMLWYIMKNTITNYYGPHTDDDLPNILSKVQVSLTDEVVDYTEPGKSVIESLREMYFKVYQTEPEPEPEPQDEKISNVYLKKVGDSVQFRSSFTNENDIAITSNLSGSANKAFNFMYYYLADKNISQDVFMTDSIALKWKDAIDDVTPVNFNSSYRGANHGDDRAYTLTFSSPHGLTEANIGETWKDSNDNECVICKIISTVKLLVVFPRDTLVSNDSCFKIVTPVSPIIKDGNSITFSSYERMQITPIENHVSVKVFADNEEITEDGVYGSDYFDVVESYDLLYLPAMIQSLKNNVGSNSNTSYYSDSITEKYCTINNIYRFTERGAITLYQSIDWFKPVDFNFAGMVQSTAIGNYYCVPGTSKNTLSLFDGNTIDFTTGTWNDGNVPPNRFYQFADQSMSKGICLGFNTNFGTGKVENRNNTRTAGFIYTSKKLYPKILDLVGNAPNFDTTISAVSYRIPLTAYDSDVPSIGWYYVDDDVYLLIDVQKTVDKFIELPEKTHGMKIETVETYGSFTLCHDFVGAKGIRIKTESYGSAVLRLSK